MAEMRWFRMYTDAVDNPKLKLLAFEDRWHYVAFCCLKRSGLLDDPGKPNLERLIAVKLGVQLRELDEIKRRLMDVDLLDEDYSPMNWDERQFISDSSTDRFRKYRERKKKVNGKRPCNVSVTPPDTDTEADTEEKIRGKAFGIPLKNNTTFEPTDADLEQWRKAYPRLDLDDQLHRIAAWNASNKDKRKTIRGIRRHINGWLDRQDEKLKAVNKSAEERCRPFPDDN